MVIWFDVLWWGYIALWAVLLIHCLLKRTFFPIFGPGWGTKVFWLVTFVFMDPLLTLLYMIFGVFFSWRQSDGIGSPKVATICLVLTILTIGFFELPKSNEPAKEMTVVHSEQQGQPKKGFQAQVGSLQANHSISTATSSGSSGSQTRFCAKSIVIENKSDDLLIDKACRIIQEKMAELPYVQEVQYWPGGAEMAEPLGQGDVFMVVDARELTISEFGIKRTVKANLLCQVGTEPLEKSQHSYHGYSPPVIQFSMNCHLKHDSIFKGFETSKARYQQQSNGIAEQFVGAITKQFDTWIEKHGLLPELPDYLYTKDPNIVTLEFLADKGPTLLYHSGGLLRNCRSLWTYEENRPNLEAFREIRDQLLEQGWQGGYAVRREYEPEREIHGFTMRRDNERLQIFRTRSRNDFGGIVFGEKEKLPIGVEYVSLLPPERVHELLSRFFQSDADIETKLIFQDFNSDEGLKQLLVDSVQSGQVKTMQGYLLVGRFYADKDEMVKATEALMMARVLGRANRQHNPAPNEIKSLAEKIGDESLAQTEVPVEYYERAGFVNLATAESPSTFERGLGEPLVFYNIQAGDPESKIRTVAITMTQAPGKDDHYQMTKVEKAKGMSSIGTRDATEIVFLNDLSEETPKAQLDIEQLEDDRFKLTLRKK